MNLFLRGAIGVGKSTVIDRTVEKLNRETPLKIGGFMTFRGKTSDGIYLAPAAVPRDYRGAKRLVIFNGVPQILPGAFDIEAKSAIERSLPADLLIFDELGFFEQRSPLFQNAILSLLDADTPVFGVLKTREVEWYSKILCRGDITLLEVTEDNRDSLVEVAYDILRDSI